MPCYTFIVDLFYFYHIQTMLNSFMCQYMVKIILNMNDIIPFSLCFLFIGNILELYWS